MLAKEVTYTDFNGNERTETFRFNLSKAEMVEMDIGAGGGMAEKLRSIATSKDIKKIGETFKEILLKSYGEKSDDGKRFIKSDEISKAFSETEAYNEIFMELATNAKAAADFINAVLPTNFNKQ